MRDEFEVHRLSEPGMAKARDIAEVFSTCIAGLERICGPGGREMAIVRTKLQEACFFAQRTMASESANQATS